MTQNEGHGSKFDHLRAHQTNLTLIANFLSGVKVERARSSSRDDISFTVMGIFGNEMVVSFGHHYLRFPLLEEPTVDSIQYYHSLLYGPQPLRSVDSASLSFLANDFRRAIAGGVDFNEQQTHDFMQIGSGGNVGFASRRPDLSQTADLLARAKTDAVPNTVTWHMITGVQAAFKI